MSSDLERTISLNISFRGQTHALSLLPETTLDELYTKLEELTEVPPSLQKILYKGKKNGLDGSLSISRAGLKSGLKMQLLGSTMKELDGMKAVENEQQSREKIMKERALKPQVKLRSTGSGPIASLNSSSSVSLQYRFHDIKPLGHLPKPEEAQNLLKKLSEDPGIQHIMQKHKFSVGLLTELAPHEHPELLGLNENAGQAIKLRIRTDKYDGFRLYREIRRVLCHELTHNVWGDHDENFKELNSKLNREVAEFERSKVAGTHYLAGGPEYDVYQPSSELEAEANTYILGGSSSSNISYESQEDRRRRILEATMNRLRKEEEDIEHSCGTHSTSH